MDQIRDTDLEGLLLIRDARPQPRPRAHYIQAWAGYIQACKLMVRFLLCMLFLYALYPIVPAMGVSTVCRLPEKVRPSSVCRVGDVHSFQLQTLFDAVESANAKAQFWYEKTCDVDSGLSKLAAPLEPLIQHQGSWNFLESGDNDEYYRRSHIDLALRAEVLRSQAAREAASNLTALCRELGGFRRGAVEQADRDLALSLYRTTGHWARLLHRLRISTIDEQRVDDLATALVASVNATFERGETSEAMSWPRRRRW
ncbi:hypothetical protein PG991_000960 [Apiospora marii]|uniref:Uncharacterized protein n=1 Tax=Apiospora marii TaxID=335849 RepID=A0ABR1STI5_9PEZI